MKRALLALGVVLLPVSAWADSTLPALSAATAAARADLLPTSQGGGNLTKQTVGSVADTAQIVNGVSYPASPSTNTVPVVTSANTITYEALPAAALASGAAATNVGALGGDLSGSLPSPTVAKVNGVAYGTSPSTNTVPVVTGSNTVTYEALPAAALASGAAATNVGTLGGDLSGTLPSPTVAKVNGVAYGTSPSTNTVPVVTGSNTITYEGVPVAAGGTGLASGTSGGVLGFTASGTLASSALLAANGIMLGGGAGATPTATAAMTDGQLLVGQTSAAPLPKTVTGDVTFTAAGATAIKSAVALAGSPTTTTQSAKDNSTKIATTAYVDRPTDLQTTGTTATLTAPREYLVCTSTCTVTVPVPAAGYEFCVMNDDNVATVITLAAIGSSARYENTARTAYGTAGTGTFVSGGAAGDKICLLGRDATHYFSVSFNGTWVAN